MMRVPDHRELAAILRSGPVRTDRQSRRRNLAKRLERGKVRDLTTADLHMIRQARYIDRVGRAAYNALHVVTPRTDLHTNGETLLNAVELGTLKTVLYDYFERSAVVEDAVTLFLITDMSTIRFTARDGLLAVSGYTGYPEASALSELARADRDMNGAIQKAFACGPVQDVGLANQIQAAREAIEAGEGPIFGY